MIHNPNENRRKRRKPSLGLYKPPSDYDHNLFRPSGKEESMGEKLTPSSVSPQASTEARRRKKLGGLLYS